MKRVRLGSTSSAEVVRKNKNRVVFDVSLLCGPATMRQDVRRPVDQFPLHYVLPYAYERVW
jgi:hypothetical protein